MNASLAVIIAMAVTAGNPMTLVVRGSDPAPGLLVNRTVGARPFDAPDPSRPTVVFIHGINPTPGLVRFEMAQRLAEAVARRHGAGAFNMMDWDWNAATLVSVRRRGNTDAAIEQGRLLAGTLLAAGIDPARLHLIGHSAGSTVASAAARALVMNSGVRVAHLTFLEPAAFTHEAVFVELTPASSARHVENYWSPGLSAYGRASGVSGVRDHQINQQTPLIGMVIPSRSAHMGMVAWYVTSVESPDQPLGFNTSLLLRP